MQSTSRYLSPPSVRRQWWCVSGLVMRPSLHPLTYTPFVGFVLLAASHTSSSRRLALRLSRTWESFPLLCSSKTAHAKTTLRFVNFPPWQIPYYFGRESRRVGRNKEKVGGGLVIDNDWEKSVNSETIGFDGDCALNLLNEAISVENSVFWLPLSPRFHLQEKQPPLILSCNLSCPALTSSRRRRRRWWWWRKVSGE